MTSGYGTGRTGTRTDAAHDRDRRGRSARRPAAAPRAPPGASPRPRRLRWPTGSALRRMAAASSTSAAPAAIAAISGTQEQADQDDRLAGEGRAARRTVAGRREPTAAGQLADQPAEPERDREPAEDRPDGAAAQSARSRDPSGRVQGRARRGPGPARDRRRRCGTRCGPSRDPVPRLRPASGRGPWRSCRPRRRRPASGVRTRGRLPPRARSCGSGRPRSRLSRVSRSSAASRAPAPGFAARSSRAGLVLRPVLSRIRIFLRVDRPVRAARRAVPAAPPQSGSNGPASAPS